jgi:MSHA biogenesis protein MshP
MSTTSLDCRQGGFTLVSAIFLVVVLAALGTAMATVALRTHGAAAAEVESARALQSARAGLEWAAFQLLRNPAPPAAAPACFGATSFAPAALAAYTVTVSCTRTDASDGATALVFYRVVANACNAPAGGNCPTTGTPPSTYVERQLAWTLGR